MLEQLQEAHSVLQAIQRGLNDYLETKRLASHAFCSYLMMSYWRFLQKPKIHFVCMQPHLKKLF